MLPLVPEHGGILSLFILVLSKFTLLTVIDFHKILKQTRSKPQLKEREITSRVKIFLLRLETEELKRSPQLTIHACRKKLFHQLVNQNYHKLS